MSIPVAVLSELGKNSDHWSKNNWINKIIYLSRTYGVSIDADMLSQIDYEIPGSGSKFEMVCAFSDLGVCS